MGKIEKPWPEDIKNSFTCTCGGMTTLTSVLIDGDETEKYQVSCTACGMKGPESTKKGAAINEWNIIVEALCSHRKVVEIIKIRVSKENCK